MVERWARAPRRKGFRAYLFSEVEEHHLRFLGLFLSFIYYHFRDDRTLCSWLLPLITEPESVDPAQLPAAEWKKFLSAFDFLRGLTVQIHCRKGFENFLKEADRSGEVSLSGLELKLRLKEIRSGRKVFWFGPEKPKVWDHRSIAKYLLATAGWCLALLGRDAILKCEQCKHFFLRKDQREARYCSQPCRVIAYQERQEKKGARRSGAGKRVIAR